MKQPDTRNLDAMPNTLAWLKDHITGFSEHYEAAKRSNKRDPALDALLEAQQEKPNVK